MSYFHGKPMVKRVAGFPQGKDCGVIGDYIGCCYHLVPLIFTLSEWNGLAFSREDKLKHGTAWDFFHKSKSKIADISLWQLIHFSSSLTWLRNMRLSLSRESEGGRVPERHGKSRAAALYRVWYSITFLSLRFTLDSALIKLSKPLDS